MKVLVIGDLHFKIGDFQKVVECTNWLKILIKEHNPYGVVCLGDVFNDHATIRSEILSQYINFVKDVTSEKPYVHVVGNHEFYKAGDGAYNALETYKNTIDGFYVVDEPTDIAMGGEFWATYVPYIPECQHFPKVTLPVTFAHQSFLGADFGHIKDKFALDPNTVKSDIIISGHIHKRQTLGNVIYPGSVYAKDNRDIDEVKGVMLFDTASLQYSFIDSPFSAWKGLNVDLSLSNTNVVQYIKECINDKDVWSLTITGYKAEIMALINSKEFKRLKETATIKVKTNMLDSIKKSKQIQANNVDDSIKEFVNNIYEGSIDKTLLLEKIEKIKKEIGGV